jgi:hypothetical protein
MRENLPTLAEVQQILQHAVLNHYPNREGTSSPGTSILEQTAQQSLPPEASHWMHIIHCSPCYREFLTFRDAYLHKMKRRARLLKVIGIALAILATVLYGPSGTRSF